mmetsp:Transcript_5097/g.17781  ORF Transcript_5097/g.17781 Transcript_5097/m.17781 type:complete len:288 (+) Transcript_5097:142-1005(+)
MARYIDNAPAYSFGIRDVGRGEMHISAQHAECMPGPATYNVRPTTRGPKFTIQGRSKHQPTPYNQRLWSARSRSVFGPGPTDYSTPSRQSARSLVQPTPPAFSMGGKPAHHEKSSRSSMNPRVPGPSDYTPCTPKNKLRAPHYTFDGRAKESPTPANPKRYATLWSARGKEDLGPGPMRYDVVDKSNAPAFSIQSRAKGYPTPISKTRENVLWSVCGRHRAGPGPQDYYAKLPQHIKKAPMFSMLGRAKETPTPTHRGLWSARQKSMDGPGPQDYNIQRWPVTNMPS